MNEHILAVLAAMSHNNPVPDIVKATAHVAVLDLEATIHRLDDEISRLVSTIEDLKRQKSNIAARIRQYRSTFAPHRSVPNEILGEIFLHCNPAEVDIPWDLKVVPWSISYVCVKWRSVALSTLDLWRNIQVDYGRRRHPRILDMIMEVILRGGDMHISMRATGHKYPAAFFELIAANLSSFKCLDFRGSQSELMPILSLPSGNAKNLEMLDIGCPGVIPPLSFLEGATCIRELVIPESIIPVPSLFRLSLSKISYFDISATPLKSEDVFSLFNRCPVLRVCWIAVEGPEVPIQSTLKSRSLTLPCLEDLTIYPIDSAFPGFLANLIMPRLSFLEIKDAVGWTIDFTLAISYSQCLRYLQLRSPLNMASLEILLPAAPNIRNFEISEAELSLQTLQGIARGTLLSKVSQFDFACVVPTLEALGWHLDMIEQRPDIQEELRLHLLWDYDLDDPAPVMRRLHDMMDEGWRLQPFSDE